MIVVRALFPMEPMNISTDSVEVSSVPLSETIIAASRAQISDANSALPNAAVSGNQSRQGGR